MFPRSVENVQLPDATTSSRVLGGTYLLLGVVEVVAHRDGTERELLFWGGSLIGGGALVLVGAALLDRQRALGLALLTIGVVLGLNATLWTVVIPLLAIWTLVRAYREIDAGLVSMQAPTETPHE